MLKRCALVILSAVLSACGTTSSEALTSGAFGRDRITVIDDGASGNRRVEEITRGLATICRVAGKEFPASYLVSDIDRKGLPRTTSANRDLAKKIARYLPRKSLRFETFSGEFIVYNANRGACNVFSPPGYWVLNARGCNAYFMPVDGVFTVPLEMEGCITPDRPWFPRERTHSKITWQQWLSVNR